MFGGFSDENTYSTDVYVLNSRRFQYHKLFPS